MAWNRAECVKCMNEYSIYYGIEQYSWSAWFDVKEARKEHDIFVNKIKNMNDKTITDTKKINDGKFLEENAWWYVGKRGQCTGRCKQNGSYAFWDDPCEDIYTLEDCDEDK